MPHRGAGTEYSPSELEWLRVNDYLRRNRYELAVRAADGYPAGARVAGTPLLAAPEWLPGKPVPLERVRLSLEPEAPQPRITATDIKTLAPALLPERPGGIPYRRHSDVIGELAAPAVFENRVTYRLTGADLAGEEPHLGFTLGRFFDGIDVGGAAAHEYAAAELDPGKGRPLRAAIKDPCDLAARPHAMAVGALTLRHDRAAGTVSFPLHWRDPRRVGHAGGMFQVIPVGIFQPSGEAEWNVATDFSLWRGLLREYAEELLGADEDHGSETAPIDYESWPLARRMTRALADGRIRAWCLGLGADPLTFAMDLLTVVVIDAPLYDELFGAAVTDNAEGTVLPLRPFDAVTVRELLGNHPVQAAGAALLTLALGHRDTLLAGLPAALLPAALAPFGQVRALGPDRRVAAVARVYPGRVGQPPEELLRDAVVQRLEPLRVLLRVADAAGEDCRLVKTSVKKIAMRESNISVRVHHRGQPDETRYQGVWPVLVDPVKHRKVVALLTEPNRRKNVGQATNPVRPGARRHLLS